MRPLFTLIALSLILLPGLGTQAQGPTLTHAVAVGDATDSSAVLWARLSDRGRIAFDIDADAQYNSRDLKSVSVDVDESTDFVAKATIRDLKPDTRYHYRARAAAGPAAVGSFKTAPDVNQALPLTMLWSGDLGGQTFCRQPEYKIFRAMADLQADQFWFLGDTIYADESCPSPPNLPGGEAVASQLATIDAYRAKHRYNRADEPYLQFLSQTALYAIWDDHEVVDNFSGPFDPRTPLGRQAFLDYYPIAVPKEDPHRMYRSFRWGKNVELFALDNRQYRSRNTDPDGPNKTMLGAEQLQWLKGALTGADALWKIIVTSVTLSHPGSCPLACDGWANGTGNTGYERELLDIVGTIKSQAVKNVIWLSADVHYPLIVSYDADGDGTPDFHEFSAGPLSTLPGSPRNLDTSLRPKRLYFDTGFYNFGVVRIDAKGQLTVEIRDINGKTRYQQTLTPS